MNKHKSLANRLYEVICGNLTCINAWGVYLFNSDFDAEPELRNKVGVIWLCSLFDTLEAERKFIPEIIKEAKSEGWESLVHNGYQLQILCKLSSELLNLFTREEQIFLIDLRNQWTHGYLRNRHNDYVSVKYIQNGDIKYVNLSHTEFAEINRFFYEKKNLDDTLKSLILRVIDKKHRYWTAVNFLKNHEKEMYRMLLDGETFNIIL